MMASGARHARRAARPRPRARAYLYAHKQRPGLPDADLGAPAGPSSVHARQLTGLGASVQTSSDPILASASYGDAGFCARRGGRS